MAVKKQRDPRFEPVQFRTKTLPAVRFRLPWGTYRKGDVIRPAGTLRDHLVKNGLAVLVDEKPQKKKATKRGGKAS